jgi:hypothetical protein
MGRDTTGKTTKAGGIMSKTLKDLALELGYDESRLQGAQGWKEDSFLFLMLDDRHGVFQDDKGLHLTDLVSWARFSPRIIGRKSNATIKGLQFQVAQLKQYQKQIGG